MIPADLTMNLLVLTVESEYDQCVEYDEEKERAGGHYTRVHERIVDGVVSLVLAELRRTHLH